VADHIDHGGVTYFGRSKSVSPGGVLPRGLPYAVQWHSRITRIVHRAGIAVAIMSIVNPLSWWRDARSQAIYSLQSPSKSGIH
jgi:signal recognition particle subunit SEC65